MKKKMSSARKAAESTLKHEDLVDAIEKLGKSKGLDVEATEGNDKRGDIRVSKKDFEKLMVIISDKLEEKNK
ncbi:hypothetical protein [Psychrobacter sp. APC 3350]|uniref:hypothetical protein n=1 Tax=Psychrobacter sp. APC 3350 TaxID=3035195 RepID=UPI0025B49FFA|nr:hypothetical protein [Psychrobacter sp. APC 3350]MDN3454741.1 hypothetical protein [Psychrobacter sp. APC 3350]